MNHVRKRAFQNRTERCSRIERKRQLTSQLNNILWEKELGDDEIKFVNIRLNRVMNYLINYTDIKSLTEIHSEHLIEYMKYSIENSFLQVSFKELKGELVLLEKILEGVNHNAPHINMSLENFNLWTSLFKSKKFTINKEKYI